MKRLTSLRYCTLLSTVFAMGMSGETAADTVYLKNGAWIDGVVVQRDDSVLVRIGDIGRVEIELEDVYAIEKNSLTGTETTVASVEARGVEITRSEDEADDKDSSKDEDRDDESGDKKSKDEAEDSGAGDASDSGGDEEGESEVEQIAPELKERIERHVQDLQRQRAKFRVRAERHLKQIGVPAIPFLLPLAKNRSEQTRVAVMRLFLAFGDERVVEGCVDALLDSNEYVRDFAHQTLRRVTLENFGFHPNASPRRRRFAQQKWAKWWRAEQKELEEARALARQQRQEKS